MRVCIETYGCAFNQSDSEVLIGLLEQDACEIVSAAEQADAIIVNSCTVKDRSYLEFKKRLAELARLPNHPVIIVAGCIPRIPEHAREIEHLSRIGPDSLGSITDVVRRAVAGEHVVQVERAAQPRLRLPRRRRNPAVEILPISKGCVGRCTFCQTVIARGRLQSFPAEEILAHVAQAIREGVRIVWLTSQDCGAYGLDEGIRLPELMRRISTQAGEFRCRVGMSNPDLLKSILTEYVAALDSPAFFRFAHIPLQSGSDGVLSDMRRMYTVDDFCRICHALRERMPDISIATDVIVGYPTETDEDFEQTLAVLRETRPSTINRSRFSPRPGTAAARLNQLPSKVTGERSRRLARLVDELVAQDFARWQGWTGEAIVEECSSSGSALARNHCYKPILLEGTYEPGQRVHVRTDEAHGFHLCACMCAAQAEHAC